jgi:hypothetical protein
MLADMDRRVAEAEAERDRARAELQKAGRTNVPSVP